MATVQGRAALKRKFAAMPRAVREEVAKALIKSAEELTGMQKRLVPVKTGALRDAIGWTHGTAPEGSLSADKASDFGVTIYAGSKDAWYARLVEFGTKTHDQGGQFLGTTHPGTPPRPFFYPSYRALKKRIRSRLSRAFTTGIKKAAKG